MRLIDGRRLDVPELRPDFRQRVLAAAAERGRGLAQRQAKQAVDRPIFELFELGDGR
jgi:hypothetical protein